MSAILWAGNVADSVGLRAWGDYVDNRAQIWVWMVPLVHITYEYYEVRTRNKDTCFTKEYYGGTLQNDNDKGTLRDIV